MQTWIQKVYSLFTIAAINACLLAMIGCSASRSGSAPKVDPQAAAAFAMEHYDVNKNGSLESSELASSPALAAALSSFDTDGDHRLGQSEISEGLKRMYRSRMDLTEMTCTVTLKGQPLARAEVRLDPIDML